MLSEFQPEVSRDVIPGAQDQLTEKKTKGHKRHIIQVRRKLTFFHFNLYYSNPEHGGYTVSSIKEKWAKEIKGLEPMDARGVVNGVG